MSKSRSKSAKKESGSSSSSSASSVKLLDVHRWSGWPGAYCLDCQIEDQREICIGDGHDEDCKLPKCQNPVACVVNLHKQKQHIKFADPKPLHPDFNDDSSSFLLSSSDAKSTTKKRKTSRRLLKSLPALKRRKVDEKENVYTVSEIRLMTPNGKECFVHWEGYTEQENSWIPTTDILDPQLIKDYQDQKKWKFQYVNTDATEWKDMDASVQDTIAKQFDQWLELSDDLNRSKNVLYKIRDFDYVMILSRYIHWDQENCTHHDHTVRLVRRVPA